MNEGSAMEVNGVVVPPEAVAHSNEVKASKRKTLSQIPVYRASANLMYVVTEIVMRMPNKLRKYSDLMLLDARVVTPTAEGWSTSIPWVVSSGDTSSSVGITIPYVPDRSTVPLN